MWSLKMEKLTCRIALRRLEVEFCLCFRIRGGVCAAGFLSPASDLVQKKALERRLFWALLCESSLLQSLV